MCGIEFDSPAAHPCHQIGKRIFHKHPAAVEHIYEKLFARVEMPDDEMTGQAYAVNGKTELPRHFYVNDREGDGNPCATVYHFIEETIARVVVIFSVALKSKFIKKCRIDTG